MHSIRTHIVEDSPVICANLIETLEELTSVVVVRTSNNEAEAVRWLTENSGTYELVIIDIFLKNGSGLGVLRAAQSLGNGATLVVLTNYATPEMKRSCLSLGAARFFDKTTELDDLVAFCMRLGTGAAGRTLN